MRDEGGVGLSLYSLIDSVATLIAAGKEVLLVRWWELILELAPASSNTSNSSESRPGGHCSSAPKSPALGQRSLQSFNVSLHCFDIKSAVSVFVSQS